MYVNELINNYTEEKVITYKGERYSVRDNGAIKRHALMPGMPRPLDEIWTFGKKDNKTGYMMYGGHRVHIIVANAFHGERDSKQYVVDHIDTNRCNNRIENLRWFTKLENALNNPITLNKITFLCGGDIRKFIENPSCLKDLTGKYQDVMWMRTVTAEEARNAYERLMHWTNKPSTKSSTGASVGEWVYKPYQPFEEGENIKEFLDSYKRSSNTMVDDFIEDISNEESKDDFEYLTKSLTPNVYQRNWRTPTEFPLCPYEDINMESYFRKLEKGKEFCSNKYWKSIVSDYAISTDLNKLWVVCDNVEPSTKRWALTEITIERNSFVHTTLGTYFEENGVMKYFTLIQGKEWDGENSIDDYC